jgi:hypothetical protein
MEFVNMDDMMQQSYRVKKKLSLRLTNAKTYGAADVYIHVFMSLALVGELSGQLHSPAALPIVPTG